MDFLQHNLPLSIDEMTALKELLQSLAEFTKRDPDADAECKKFIDRLDTAIVTANDQEAKYAAVKDLL